MKTHAKMLTLAAAVPALLLAPPSWGQTTISNLTVTLDANALRDRLYDASTASALQRAPIHAAVLHLMDEAVRKNPAVLSAQDALDVMQNAINAMTNDFGNASELTVQNLTSAALPYLQTELSKKLPPATVNTIQTGWNILTVAEQQGLFSSVYSNLTTALPSGAVFSDVQNVASSIEALRREAASRVAALALPERIRTATDQAFRDAAGQLMSQVTSVKPDDALDSIAQSIPAFRNNPLVQKLAQDAQTAKQAVVDFNTLITSFTNVLNSLHQSVATNANLLGQIASQQSDIIGSDTNSQTVADSKNLAQQISADISANVDLAENSVTFLSTLFKIGGDAKTAQQIATVGGTAIKVANTVWSLANKVGKLADDFKDKGVFSFASAAATGNLIGAVLDVFSLFGPSEPSPDEVILDQIDAVRQDIANLSEQMNNRFDHVDAALTNIMDKLDYNLSVINTDFTYVANNLDQIRSSLFDLQGQVQRLEWQTYSYLTVLGDQDLQLALNGGLAHEMTYGSPLDYPDFQNYENTFYTWAYNFSSDDLREPVPVNCPSCYTAAGLYDQLTAHTAPEQNVGYVNSFIHNTLGLPMPFSGASVLANPRVWSITANAYSQLSLENPACFRQTASYRLNNIIQVGNNLNTFLNHLIASSTNAPNTNLWLAACNGYRSAVQDFTTALHTSLSLYYSTNSSGLGAGFNPFTNQFLSLVTPQSATMRDGYYSTATVVSVTAMACSPTPDGMPIYFLDQNTLRRLDTNGIITTLAGSTNAGFCDGTNALLNNPRGLAVAADGRVYVADTGNHAIRVTGTDGLLATLAGYAPGISNTVPVAGAADGTNGAARFRWPRAVLIDTEGNLLVADTGNHAIRKVTPAGVVMTFVGTLGHGGFRDGLTVPAAQAQVTNSAPSADSPIAVAGFNRDVIVERTATGNNTGPYASPFDADNGYAFYEAGLPAISLYGGNGQTEGLPQNRLFISALDSLTTFQLQPYNANNALYLNRTSPTGALTFTVPAAYNSLSILATSANGGGAGSVVIRFSDGSASAPISFNAPDWYDNPGAALTHFGRIFTGVWASFYTDDPAGNDPNLYQTSIDLAVQGLNTKPIASLTFTMPSGANTNTATVIFAVSGTVSTPIAQFWTPDGLVRDTNGLIYVTDRISRSVRTISTNGAVSAYAGSLEPIHFLLPQSLTAAAAPIPSQALTSYVMQLAAGASPGYYCHGGICDLEEYDDFSVGLLGNSTVAVCGYYSQWTGSPGGNLALMVAPAGLSNIVAVASGGAHALALKANGSVMAWGDNSAGQCNVPGGLSNATAIAAGGMHSLALTRSGAVVAWGANTWGECNVPAGLSNVVAVSAGCRAFYGGGVSLALRADGTVVAWGDNSLGQCNIPVGLGDVVAVAVGGAASLALKGDGSLVAWGTGIVPDLTGWGSNIDTGLISRMPPGLSNIVAISLEASCAIALRSDGTIVAWGTGLYPPCGWCDPLDSTSVSGAPIGPGPDRWGRPPLTNVAALGALSSLAIHAAVLKGDGTVVTWGDNTSGERNLPTPTLPAQGLDTTAANAAVQQFTAGLITPDGRVLVADKYGLRLFDNSDRIQRQAAPYLVKDLAASGGDLNRAGNTLKAWRLLLQTLATYALSDALANDDALHALLFGSDCLVDTDSAAATLNNLITKADWRPAHLDFAATALQRIDLLQAHVLDAVTQLAQKLNPANLPLVTDTLNRLNLLLATHDTPVPSSALELAPGTNQTVQVMLNGYPYIHYALQSSTDLQTWTTNSAGLKDGGATSLNTTAAGARFYRAVQVQ